MNSNNLNKNDIKNLKSSFISYAQIKQAGIFRIDDIEGAEIVGRKPNANTNYAGLVYPYIFPDNKQKTQSRLRLDEPQGENGKIKYLTYPGTRNMLYFIPGVEVKDLKNPLLPLIIAEGEKKSSCP